MKLVMILFVIVACAVPISVQAGNPDLGSAPPYLVYQSELYDDGGNPISDGEVDIVFRITDGQGGVLYEEQQTVEAIRGQVTALVGNGLDLNGVPTGGLSIDMLNPVGPRYLEVEVEGFSALEPMEMASVPYSLYTSMALDAADGAIDSRAIADGGVEFEDLSSGLIDQLANHLTGGAGAENIVLRQELDTLYRDPSAASTIGVSPNFVYSGADDLQAVLQDLDRAILQRDERISAEAQARQQADNAEAAARADADALKVSKSGDTMTGDLIMQGSAISLNGVLAGSWPGYKAIRHRSNTVIANDKDGNEHCYKTDDGTSWCTARVSCAGSEVLIGCSGYYNYHCWGTAGCDYNGAWPSGNTCHAQASTRRDSDQRLTAHAVCAERY
jgi:hypothetical protein